MKSVKKTKLIAYIDGASRGNPGPAAAGVVFQDTAGQVIRTLSIRIGVSTNNIAEYSALIFALQEAVAMRAKEIDIFTDSELLAKQVNGEYKIKDDAIRVLYSFVAHLKRNFSKISVTHVPRERNKLADQQANKALDQGFLL